MSDPMPIDGGFGRRVLIGAAAASGALLLLLAAAPLAHHGSIVQTSTEQAAVLSAASGKRGTRYALTMPDGRTLVVDGPSLPLYPAGSTVTVRIDRHADGTLVHRLPARQAP